MQKYLPDKYEQMVFCPLSSLQKKLYVQTHKKNLRPVKRTFNFDHQIDWFNMYFTWIEFSSRYRHALNSKDIQACWRNGMTQMSLSLILALRQLCEHPDLVFDHVQNECVDDEKRDIEDDPEEDFPQKSIFARLVLSYIRNVWPQFPTCPLPSSISIFEGSRDLFGEAYKPKNFNETSSGKFSFVDG